MDLPGREQFRAAVLRYIEVPGAKFFRAIKLTPNGITILGFLITVISAYLVGAGWLGLPILSTASSNESANLTEALCPNAPLSCS